MQPLDPLLTANHRVVSTGSYALTAARRNLGYGRLVDWRMSWRGRVDCASLMLCISVPKYVYIAIYRIRCGLERLCTSCIFLYTLIARTKPAGP